MRVNWFPQKYVRRVQQYVARQRPNRGSHHSLQLHSVLYPCSCNGLNFIGSLQLSLREEGIPLKQITKSLVPFCAHLSPLVRQNPSMTSGLRLFPWTKKIIRTPSSRWILQRSGFPSTNVKPSWINSRKLFEDQQACNNFATEIYGAKETPFSVEYVIQPEDGAS